MLKVSLYRFLGYCIVCCGKGKCILGIIFYHDNYVGSCLEKLICREISIFIFHIIRSDARDIAFS